MSHDVLYDADSDSGTITLSASAANYSYMRIYFHTNDGNYSSVDVYSPNGKTVLLLGGYFSNTNGYLKPRCVKISGTSISTHNTEYAEIQMGSTNTYYANLRVHIARVEAWNV